MFIGRMTTSRSPITSICVYCGSQPGLDPAYRQAARVLGKAMAESGIDLVYGGGTKGLMGEVADAVMSAEQSLQAAVAIRDKIISAYMEISRMAI